MVVITDNFQLLVQAVEAFDSRFTLRALRSISTIRKAKNLPVPILLAIRTAYPNPQTQQRRILESVLPNEVKTQLNGASAPAAKGGEEEQPDEIFSYLGVLIQVMIVH